MTHQRFKKYLWEIWQNNEPKDVQIGVATLCLEEIQTFTTLT